MKIKMILFFQITCLRLHIQFHSLSDKLMLDTAKHSHTAVSINGHIHSSLEGRYWNRKQSSHGGSAGNRPFQTLKGSSLLRGSDQNSMCKNLLDNGHANNNDRKQYIYCFDTHTHTHAFVWILADARKHTQTLFIIPRTLQFLFRGLSGSRPPRRS